MEIDLITVLGLCAAAGTTGAFLPQVIRTARLKETKDISLAMYIVMLVGISLWLVYGILRSDLPVIAANALTLVLVAAVLGMKIKYG
ncbi:MAG: SemiSWEET transporter [Candidatus Brocadiia bacterium]